MKSRSSDSIYTLVVKLCQARRQDMGSRFRPNAARFLPGPPPQPNSHLSSSASVAPEIIRNKVHFVQRRCVLHLLTECPHHHTGPGRLGTLNTYNGRSFLHTQANIFIACRLVLDLIFSDFAVRVQVDALLFLCQLTVIGWRASTNLEVIALCCPCIIHVLDAVYNGPTC